MPKVTDVLRINRSRIVECSFDGTPLGLCNAFRLSLSVIVFKILAIDKINPSYPHKFHEFSDYNSIIYQDIDNKNLDILTLASHIGEVTAILDVLKNKSLMNMKLKRIIFKVLKFKNQNFENST